MSFESSARRRFAGPFFQVLLFEPLLFQPGFQFFANNGQVRWSFDANANTAALDADDSNSDLVADE